MQTKSHYSQIGTTSQDINVSTQLHENAHQWMGNAVTLERWPDIWFNEGWATWSEWIWGFEANGGDSPEAIFDDLYANTPDEDWAIAPAVLDGDPVNLFAGFPVYDRGAMVVQGTREIIGEAAFDDADRAACSRDFRYGNISTQEFITLAKERQRVQRSEPGAARRLLRAVALRRGQADDPARGLRGAGRGSGRGRQDSERGPALAVFEIRTASIRFSRTDSTLISLPSAVILSPRFGSLPSSPKT